MARDMRITFDNRDIERLVVDISQAPFRMRKAARQVVRDTATEVKVGMRKDATGHRYLPKFSRAIGVDKLGELSYEIGWKYGRQAQGSLAHIIVFGSVNNDPVYDRTGPLRRIEPTYLRRMADAAEDSVFKDAGRS